MYNDGLNATQRYYRRNREKLLAKKREKYHSSPELRKHILDKYTKWRKEHPYEYHKLQKKYRDQQKAKMYLSDNKD